MKTIKPRAKIKGVDSLLGVILAIFQALMFVTTGSVKASEMLEFFCSVASSWSWNWLRE